MHLLLESLHKRWLRLMAPYYATYVMTFSAIVKKNANSAIIKR
jgi:hypothetical protein